MSEDIETEPDFEPAPTESMATLKAEIATLRARVDEYRREVERRDELLAGADADLKEARVRRAELEEELTAICDATGYVNRAEGQGGYERISGQGLARKWREKEDEADEARARVVELETLVSETAEHNLVTLHLEIDRLKRQVKHAGEHVLCEVVRDDLRGQLATARREALEEAIRICWDEEATSCVERIYALAAPVSDGGGDRG